MSDAAFFCKKIIIIILVLASDNLLYTFAKGEPKASAKDELINNLNYKQFSSVVCFFTGIGFSTSSIDFFKEYNKYFNENTDHLKVTPVLGVAFKFKILEDYRFGISFDYVGASMKDYFRENFTAYSQNYIRDIGENISITSIPCLLNVELLPLENQFQNYLGLGAGIVYSSIVWREDVSTNYAYDRRKSSTIMDKTTIYPAFKIYTGIELGFDRHQGTNFLGCLIFETSYTFLMRYTDIYSNLTEQFSPAPDNWGRSYAIFPGFINLSIGLSFNFQRRYIK